MIYAILPCTAGYVQHYRRSSNTSLQRLCAAVHNFPAATYIEASPELLYSQFHRRTRATKP